MKEIFCQIAMFNYKQGIYLRSEDNDIACLGYVETSNLPKTIGMFCDKYDVNHVHIFGAADYVTGVAQNIKYVLVQNYNYSDNDIIVEVN